MAAENGWTAAQIRVLIEQAICAERRLRDHLRAEDRGRFEEYRTALSRALDLQAKEYERRLEILNHAHAEQQRILAIYLPRELYERAHGEVVEWQRKADIRNVEIDARIKKVELGLVDLPGGVKSLELGLASQAGSVLGARMTRATLISIVAVIGGLIAGTIALLNYLSK